MGNFVPLFLKKPVVLSGIVGSCTIIILFLLMNLGASANALVMSLNDDKMPVVIDPSLTHDPTTYTGHQGARMAWLGDIFEMRIDDSSPTWFGKAYHRTIDFLTGDEGPGRYYFSLGDLLIWVGSRPLVPLSVAFGVFTIVVGLMARQHSHQFFQEFRHQPDTPARTRRLVDGVIALALLAIFASVIYGSWFAR